MTELVLLGAGASAEAGVPTSVDMTKRILRRFSDEFALERHRHIIAFAIGGLLFQKGVEGRDPFDGVDVEALFNAVQLLADRHELGVSPFVGSWHAMVDELDKRLPPAYAGRLDRLSQQIYEGVVSEIASAFPKQSSFQGQEIDKRLDQTIKVTVDALLRGKRTNIPSHQSVSRAIGEYMSRMMQDWLNNIQRRRPRSDSRFIREFQKAVEEQRAQPGQGAIFRQTTELMIRILKDLVWIDTPKDVAYLAPLLNLLRMQGRLVIATLNYDNAIELLAEGHDVQCQTGIDEWSRTGSFTLSGDGLFLLKIHGSIDWESIDGAPSPDRPLPHRIIRRVSPERLNGVPYRPAVIFGQRNKLTAEGPFLDLLRAFKGELARSTTVTAIGYSFRDAHINEYLLQWLNADPCHRLRIIARNFDSNHAPFAMTLRRYARDRLEIISAKASEGLARVWGSD